MGQRIKKYRKSRGYTIEQFSAMINKSKATLSKYENGAITIDIETLYEIAQALDIDLKCFIDYQPPMFHAEPALPKNSYFNQTLAYMYYYDGRIRQMVRSLLRFSQSVDHESVEVTLYMGVASFSDPDRCQHLFTGEMKRLRHHHPHGVDQSDQRGGKRCISVCSIPCRTVCPPWDWYPVSAPPVLCTHCIEAR